MSEESKSIDSNTRSITSPPCVICTGEMKVKEIRKHSDPGFEVYFLKCRDCGLERPVVLESERE